MGRYKEQENYFGYGRRPRNSAKPNVKLLLYAIGI
jgi:hypothetical protein